MNKLTLTLLLFGVGISTARADIIQVNLASPSQHGSPGDLLQFFGTITNLSATDTLYFNAAGEASVSPDLTIDVIPYFLNKPASLNPGETSFLFEMFDISIGPAAAPGPYIGSTVSFQGGPDGGQVTAFDNLGAASVDVIVKAAAVPEPASAGLWLTGAALLAALHRRRSRRSSTSRTV